MASEKEDVKDPVEEDETKMEVDPEVETPVINSTKQSCEDEAPSQEKEDSEEKRVNHTEENEESKEENEESKEGEVESKEGEEDESGESGPPEENTGEDTEEKTQKKRPNEDADNTEIPEKKSKLDEDSESKSSNSEENLDKKEESINEQDEKPTTTDISEEEEEKGNKKSDTPSINGESEIDTKEESEIDTKESVKDANSTPSPKVNGVSDSPNNKREDDEATVKSEDSEKENRQTEVDLPMDLTTKSGSSNGNGPDVIMLSDSEEELVNGMVNGDVKGLSNEELKLRKHFIKQLQAELRNEEAKLVLLKRLRQSQITTHQVQENVSKPPKHHSQPPPLVRAGQQQSQARPAHSQPPQLLRNTPVPQNRGHQQGPPPLVLRGQNMNSRSSLEQQMRYQGMSGANSSSLYRQGPNSNSQSQQSAGNSQQVADNQTPAQRQAAAKMALRKQLEKTLLQIPPPKPPPPEMNFVPSLASPDFIYLLGLEEAVNYIIDANLISKGQKNPDEKMVCNPFTCVQCGTDFTPVWKREKAGSKNVICEHCVTTNQKKALKQEHTNRLKSAFVKALQQEQEIERMQAQEKTAQNTSSNNSPAPAGSASSPMTLPSLVASYKANSEALRQHQNFLQAHQTVAAHQTALRMGQPLGLAPYAARGTFPYQIPFGAKPQDLNQLQRQYLLDMIPNRGGAMSWKP